MHLDASLTGLGAVFHNMVYNLPLPKGYMGDNIVQLEILNIVVACKVWANHWSNKRIKIWCDNQAVVKVLTTGRCKDKTLAVCARNIGQRNVMADLLSRWTNSTSDNGRLQALVPNFLWIPTYIDLIILNYRI